MDSFLIEAANVIPSARQLEWFDMEQYAFIHFGVNTFTDREWGDGTEPESVFNPSRLDCAQWVNSIKKADMRGMVLTAKHHDGFCLWPSKYTEHSVKNSPCQVDVVKAAADACRLGGIKFGFYLSPWDRNSKLYGTPEYNNYFCDQLTELLTEYGEIFYVWFDNACGEGPNGRQQIYDFPRYFELIRKYQPNAVIFNDFGPDVRWCGNEAGSARYSEWSVVPSELCRYAKVQTGPGPLAFKGSLDFIYNHEAELGSLSNILYSKGLVYTPAEINMSIRPGWFWHENEEPHSLQRLFRAYLDSVGDNACFHLNVPPNRNGLIDERDVKRLEELGNLIDREFVTELSANSSIERTGTDMQPYFTVPLSVPLRDAKYVVISEDISRGQRVESFRITAGDDPNAPFPLYQGTTIGHKKICPLGDPFAEQNPLTANIPEDLKTLTVKVTAARADVNIKSIKVY